MKPVLKINNKSAESLMLVRGWLIAFGVISIIVAVVCLVMSMGEEGWIILVPSIPLFLLAGATNGLVGIAKASAIYIAKMNEEYDIQIDEKA